MNRASPMPRSSRARSIGTCWMTWRRLTRMTVMSWPPPSLPEQRCCAPPTPSTSSVGDKSLSVAMLTSVSACRTSRRHMSTGSAAQWEYTASTSPAGSAAAGWASSGHRSRAVHPVSFSNAARFRGYGTRPASQRPTVFGSTARRVAVSAVSMPALSSARARGCRIPLSVRPGHRVEDSQEVPRRPVDVVQRGPRCAKDLP